MPNDFFEVVDDDDDDDDDDLDDDDDELLLLLELLDLPEWVELLPRTGFVVIHTFNAKAVSSFKASI